MKIFFVFIIFISICGCGHDENYDLQKNITWDGGIVPYCFDDEISEKDKKKITECLNIIEKNTKCIYFIKTNSKKSICFYYSEDNVSWGTVGVSNINLIRLTKPIKERHVYHETLHALGLRHEHQRPDRSEHIKILYKNIFQEYIQYFYCVSHLYDINKIAYDTKSVMHYSPNAFTETISIEFLFEEYFGSNIPTQLDYQKIKAIYQ